ncbi:hypothetical protein A4X09_0g5588 [Tilletia walkeri]|uniref:Uncharacterized protein n=1 Tax=Tilletia walkeri TaxID=117179 RepID=A0A8X7N490_9BASI|nr:hypothetical protein A4X09_0g5588 [Tilletia walkeri]
MISISSSKAALCPQSFASMAPCTECNHHTTPTSIPFPTSMTYLHASSSRILTPARAAQYFPDDLEAHEAARFWAQTDGDVDEGYSRKVSDAEWVGEVGDLDADDDSRSDLGAPEMDENSWNAPPPAYEDTGKAPSSTSSTHRSRRTCSDLSPEAGTLQLSVNASIVPPSPSSSPSSFSSRSTTPSSTRSAATTQITPAKPSLLSLAFLGSARALARSRARAERKAAHLEELHDAWMKLGENTRELLARGGEGALPPFFEHPPRCGLGEMMEGMPL